MQISDKKEYRPRGLLPREVIDFYSIPEPNSGCSLWLGSVFSCGYGVVNINNRAQYAHRVSWEAHHGAIPEGLHVCHRCDVPTCVNPDHLFLGTNADNVADKVAKKRAQRLYGGANGRAKLSADEVSRLRALKGTASIVNLARQFSIGTSQAGRILRGEQRGRP